MKDERFVFIDDVRKKKNVARSAHNRRTHNGKRGAVKLPSDFLTAKELKAMNGEVKTYRLNDPMTWKEFKAMPDEIKITYIKALREKFNVPDQRIGQMLGVSQGAIAPMIKHLGLTRGKGTYSHLWDKEGFWKWARKEEAESTQEDDPQPEAIHEKAPELPQETFCRSGKLTFVGSAEEAMKAARQIIGGGAVKITIEWEALTEGAVFDGN